MDITALENPIEANLRLNHASLIANHPTVVEIQLSEEQLAKRFSLYRGSGGDYAPFGISTFLTAQPTNPKPKAKPKFNPQLKSQLEHIQKSFGLTQEQLAKVCRLKSRKTLNNWYNGDSKPRTESLNRIFELSIITEAFLQSGFIYDNQLLKKPVLEGLSLLDLLSQETLDQDKIMFAGSDLHFEVDSDIKLVDPFTE